MVGRSTTWDGNLGYSRNEAGQMSHEGEAMAGGQRWVVCVHAVRMKRSEVTASSRRKDLVVVNACRQEVPPPPACQRVNAGCMRRREW